MSGAEASACWKADFHTKKQFLLMVPMASSAVPRHAMQSGFNPQLKP